MLRILVEHQHRPQTMDIFWRGKIVNNSEDLQSAFRHCSLNEKVVHLDITTRDRQPEDLRIASNHP